MVSSKVCGLGLWRLEPQRPLFLEPSRLPVSRSLLPCRHKVEASVPCTEERKGLTGLLFTPGGSLRAEQTSSCADERILAKVKRGFWTLIGFLQVLKGYHLGASTANDPELLESSAASRQKHEAVTEVEMELAYSPEL